jgi:hypothetical protein
LKRKELKGPKKDRRRKKEPERFTGLRMYEIAPQTFYRKLNPKPDQESKITTNIILKC